MSSTRGKTVHFLLGHPSELPLNVLPKNCDIFNYYKYLKENTPKLSKNQLCELITAEVIEIWSKRGNLPTNEEKSVRNKVQDTITKGQDLLKLPLNRRVNYISESLMDVTSPRRTKKKNNFEGLFDICSCSCETRNSCVCPLMLKVPEREWDFLVDQRSNRKMVIDSSITMQFSDDQIREFYSAPMLIPNYPSHCQSVERAVKLVSEVCGAGYYDHEERHKRILSNQAAKQERKSYDTKNKFKRIQKGIQTLREHNVM